VVDLGVVVCVEKDSLDLSTTGSEDVSIPSPGQVFFYLVEYADEMSSSYGKGSTDSPRTPGFAACP